MLLFSGLLSGSLPSPPSLSITISQWQEWQKIIIKKTIINKMNMIILLLKKVVKAMNQIVTLKIAIYPTLTSREVYFVDLTIAL